jgi:hypothetical protein
MVVNVSVEEIGSELVSAVIIGATSLTCWTRPGSPRTAALSSSATTSHQICTSAQPVAINTGDKILGTFRAQLA